MSLIFKHCIHFFPGRDISWAGFCPWYRTYSFGFENGAVTISPFEKKDQGKSTRWGLFPKVSEEPINCIDFLGPFAAITTRANTSILKRKRIEKFVFEEPAAFNIDLGGFGIVKAPIVNCMLAPLGKMGINCLFFDDGKIYQNIISPDEKINFYKLYTFRRHDKNDMVLAACRNDGLAMFSLGRNKTKSKITIRKFKDIDIIQAYPTSHYQPPYGVIALAKSGEILFTSDFLNNNKFKKITPKLHVGSAYSFLLISGHGVILSENYLSLIPNLVNTLIRGDDLIEAHSIAIKGDDLLPGTSSSFFLIDEGVAREFDINLFISDAKGLRATKDLNYRKKFPSDFSTEQETLMLKGDTFISEKANELQFST